MPFRLRKFLSPSIKPMPAQEEAVQSRLLRENFRYGLREPLHVLRILEDWQPFAMLVGCYASESLQHFVAFEQHSPFRGADFGKDRTRNRMRV